MRKPSIKQLEYFIAVAELESFRRAAERLRISQPTLTAQIAALEKLLGLQLFERSRTGTLLAPAGRQLLPAARRVLEEVHSLIEVADGGRSGAGGTYRMGVTPTAGPYALPHLLPDLHARYPELKLYVREGDARTLEDGLAQGRFDLALMPLPLLGTELVVTPLFREPVFLVMPQGHPLAAADRVSSRDLAGQDVLTIEGPHPFHRQVENLCERFGARLLRDYEGTSLDALRHMVVMGMGLAFLPALYVRSEIHDPSALTVTELADESISRIHALVWRPAAPARQFFASLAQDLRAIVSARLADAVMPVE